jgi:hypothetical protein
MSYRNQIVVSVWTMHICQALIEDPAGGTKLSRFFFQISSFLDKEFG